MSKMGLHYPFAYIKHKLWPKERLGVKMPIWLSTTKSQQSPRFISMQWRATYPWKVLNESYNFALDHISIGGLHTKLWASKVAKVLIKGISKLQLGSSGTKWHLGVGSVARHKEYYKEEGGGFPQVWAVVNLVNSCLLVIRSCTKIVPTMH
jgi:hypothetical protein